MPFRSGCGFKQQQTLRVTAGHGRSASGKMLSNDASNNEARQWRSREPTNGRTKERGRTKQREAERRPTRSPIVRIIGCGSVLGGARSPVGVPPRLLLEMSEHPRPASGQASWDAAATIILLGGRYPPLPVPVQCAPHGRPRITGDMMPKAAREQFARPPAGTALAPYVGSHPDTSRNERAGDV